MTVTIKDIAKAANVSFSTVSKALNDSPLVKEPTKQLILELAKEMGYETNTSAKILATGKSNAVGIYCPDLYKPEYAAFVHEVSNQLKARGYLPAVSTSGFEDAKELFARLRAGAVIVVDQKETTFANVSITLHAFNQEGDQLLMNNNSLKRESANKAANLLLSTGHQSILVISEFMSSGWLYDSFNKSAGSIHSIRHLTVNSHDLEHFYMTVRTLLDDTMPDAVVCSSRKIAEFTLLASKTLGLNIPGNMSIMAYDEMMDPSSPVSLFGLSIKKRAERISTQVHSSINQSENIFANPAPEILLNYTVKL
ncbi:LacI family DNA-binding transcriptional regulator [Jeotgalibacillus salarius]|uniref:LacI family transcriptional regulator n=1 Tax=Jeotgalibacillus salarius TaxID=546023 RepID=A0A4Y8LPG2_9BACL|nr:LacI family DNA-binding transcriptional regulator [Jeotgalibacillus salarius]TFE02837.1 LacI family transcriptional regulator [Jeotgalibacillus salarius]